MKVELTPNRGIPGTLSGNVGSAATVIPMIVDNDGGPTVTIGPFCRHKGRNNHAGSEAPKSLVGPGYPPSLYALQHHVEAPYLDPRKKESWGQFERLWPEWVKYQLY